MIYYKGNDITVVLVTTTFSKVLDKFYYKTKANTDAAIEVARPLPASGDAVTADLTFE